MYILRFAGLCVVICVSFLAFSSEAFAACPCSVWEVATTPDAEVSDPSSLEVGTKFITAEDGYITALRFYKSGDSKGGEVGHLWTADGVELATTTLVEATSTAQAAGWHESRLETPVAISSSTIYVVSYTTTSNGSEYPYVASNNYFTGATTTNGLISSPNATVSQNGVFSTTAGTFPTSSYNDTAYFADIVFKSSLSETDFPTVLGTSPSQGAAEVHPEEAITVRFNEAINPASISASTVSLKDADGLDIPFTLTYDAASYILHIDHQKFMSNTHHTLTLSSVGGLEDMAGNNLASNYVLNFTSTVDFNEGIGGPILIIYDSLDGFSQYYPEILRAEGINTFSQLSIDYLSSGTISDYDVIIMGSIGVSGSQTSILTDWVNAGGNLVLMKPDADLLGLAGVTAVGSQSDGYFLISTSTEAGAGLVGETMQYHSTAARYTLDSAAELAALYSDAITPSGNPAVSLVSLGSQGGQVATFAFDVARSIIYTRQGNPANAGLDTNGDGAPRSNDLFHPDYIDFDKVVIPQADELQRFLVRIIQEMNQDKKPIPQFWYLPHMYKTALLMAIDDHGQGDALKNYFNSLDNASAAGCSVDDWECLRATAWIYMASIDLTDGEAGTFDNRGFELGVHVNSPDCGNTDLATYQSTYSLQLAAFRVMYPSLPEQTTHRYHCVVMSDWSSQADVMYDNGIRLDMNYYYWPDSWVQDRPGYFTGSGFPMRYAQLDGFQHDVYQSPTQLVNENGMSYPAAALIMAGNATGSNEYFGILGTHSDFSDFFAEQMRTLVVDNNIPMVTARQVLDWTDARYNSNITNLDWSGNVLSFALAADTKAKGLTLMLPVESDGRVIESISRNGSPVTYSTSTIKGEAYATWEVADADYAVTYSDKPEPEPEEKVSPSNDNGTGSTATRPREVTIKPEAATPTPGSIVTTPDTVNPDPTVCLQLNNMLGLKATDATTNGEVTQLQSFLANNKSWYPEGLVTGYFGLLTQSAVQRFQSEKNVVTAGTPLTTGYGLVGPLTRMALASESCTR